MNYASPQGIHVGRVISWIWNTHLDSERRILPQLFVVDICQNQYRADDTDLRQRSKEIPSHTFPSQVPSGQATPKLAHNPMLESVFT